MKSRHLIVVLAAGLAALTVACGDNDSSGGDTSTTAGGSDTTGAAEDPLGDPNPAAGDPVTIGFIGDGLTDAFDSTGELVAARAAVDYVNEYLGGFAGRVGELVTCETHSTPAGAQDCVAEMARANTAVILNGVSGQAGTITEAAAAAGIPFIQYSGIDSATLGNENSFVITNGVSVLAAPARVAADNGDQKVGVVVIDVPSAADPVQAAAPLFYGNAGVEVEVVRVAPGTADMTPQLQAAIGNGVDHISMVGDVTFCTAVLKGLETLGFDGTVSAIPQCVDANSANVVDTEGLIVPTTRTTDPSDAEYALFLAVMDTYAAGGSTDDIAGGGYAAVVGFARAMVDHPEGEMTSDSIKATLLAMAPAQVPLGLDNSTFQCNREHIAFATSVCSTDAIVTTLDADGKPTGYQSLDLTDLLVIPSG